VETLSVEDFCDIETYYFEYPSLASLSGRLDKTHSSGCVLNKHEYDLVVSAGIEYLDDFTLMTASQLHSWTGIPIPKIQELYKAAKQMMHEFHAEKEEEIEDIHHLRQESQRLIRMSQS
jgi:hypothetical protein